MAQKQKTIVIGAGPVGALAAIYAAQRGHEVEVYEFRGDLRDESIVPLNFTKSINLALSERGINALRGSGRSALLDDIMSGTIPMRGRMIHGRNAGGDLYEEPQDYDIHGRTIYAVDRGVLNRRLLDELEALPNVKLIFNHKLVGADFKSNTAWFEQTLTANKKDRNSRPKEIELKFDFMIGADGAHSAVRYHLMKFTRMDYQQEYIDTLWCEFHIEPRKEYDITDMNSKFRISEHHLHIWPGKEHMFIAIPSLDGSFTCTLFMPSGYFHSLDANPSSITSFFNERFPGVTDLIPEPALIASFKENAHLPLISLKCKPYHFSSSAVIVGDSAHAMVPFYGQGMNAGLEDVRILFELLDKHTDTTTTPISPYPPAQTRATALEEYSQIRAPDAAAINDLALQNYVEMRASVVSKTYQLRKWLEEELSVWVPSLGWQTKYSRVSFGNERYSEIIRKSERQGKLLVRGLVGLVSAPVLLAVVLGWYRWNKAYEPTKFIVWLQGLFAWRTTP